MMDWRMGGEGNGGIPDVAIEKVEDEDGKERIEEVVGKDGRDRVWQDAWVSLGLEDMNDEKFVIEHAKMVNE
jgi:hypothetical protein